MFSEKAKKNSSIILISAFSLLISLVNAHDLILKTGVPFLVVLADGRAAHIVDKGIESSADVFSQQWNLAKYVSVIDGQGFFLSYSSYLTDLDYDILGQHIHANKWNDRSAFAGSLSYIRKRKIKLRDAAIAGEVTRVVSSNEFALDKSFSFKLSERLAMVVAGSNIHPNLKVAANSGGAFPASSFTVDVAGFFQVEEIVYSDFNSKWGGDNIQNFGLKRSYHNHEFCNKYWPANLK